MKNIHYKQFFIFFVVLFSTVVHADAVNKITISDGYIKASIPGSDITAAYMTINNNSDKAITLQKVTSSISDQIEIHQPNMTDGMMQMRQVDDVTIKANSSVVLQPSGLHLMIFALKQQITEKEMISLTLFFSNDTNINIQLPVQLYK